MSKTAYLLSSTLIIAIKEKIEKLTCYIVFKYNHWKPILKGDKASKIEFTILKKKNHCFYRANVCSKVSGQQLKNKDKFK